MLLINHAAARLVERSARHVTSLQIARKSQQNLQSCGSDGQPSIADPPRLPLGFRYAYSPMGDGLERYSGKLEASTEFLTVLSAIGTSKDASGLSNYL